MDACVTGGSGRENKKEHDIVVRVEGARTERKRKTERGREGEGGRERTERKGERE